MVPEWLLMSISKSVPLSTCVLCCIESSSGWRGGGGGDPLTGALCVCVLQVSLLHLLNRKQRSRNCRGCLRGLFLGILGLMLPFLFLLHILTSKTVAASLSLAFGDELALLLHEYMVSAGCAVRHSSTKLLITHTWP